VWHTTQRREAPEDEYVVDPEEYRGCEEAIGYMLKGWKFEPVDIGTRRRTACEVVAYYESEGCVASGAGNQTEHDHANGREPARTKGANVPGERSASPHGRRSSF
jgi:hypothetical protein